MIAQQRFVKFDECAPSIPPQLNPPGAFSAIPPDRDVGREFRAGQSSVLLGEN